MPLVENGSRFPHPTVEERIAVGKAARERVPRSSHAGWTPAPDRPDPVAVIEAENATREPQLVPIRHGRMMASAFTFYRGAAAIMAADLAPTPRAGLDVQLCGDAHLSNFGLYASPRAVMFDLNDFDETLPGPFEYDVHRLAASFVVAARNNELDDDTAAALRVVRAYRTSMKQFAEMGTLAIWYSRLRAHDILRTLRKSKKLRKHSARVKQIIDKATTRDTLSALAKLGEYVDGSYRIVSQPPIVVPLRELQLSGLTRGEASALVRQEFEAYQSTLETDRVHLSGRYRILDMAWKTVGVGSVGTPAFIVLLEGRDQHDPLFLQVKEASASVLEDHLPPSVYEHHGQRVVHGQRMMQATSDIFLGWSFGADPMRHYYWRQLRDMKGGPEVANMVPRTMRLYADICGWTLARAHARSGDPIAIAAYLGGSDAFNRAAADFATRYADQNERDYQAMLDAVASNRLLAIENV